MGKTAINHFVTSLKKANLVTNATAWTFEGRGDVTVEIRYVGVRIPNEWHAVLGPKNNLLFKFLLEKKSAWLELYLANQPPFYRLLRQSFTEHDTWERVVGNFFMILKKEKEAFIHHKTSINNLYEKIYPLLK